MFTKCTYQTQIVPAEHEYFIPSKAIKLPADMALWQRSEAYFEYTGFILAINEAIRSKSYSSDYFISPTVTNVLQLLDKLDKLIDNTPPVQQPQRFGNVAFRTWYEKLKEQAVEILQETLSVQHHRTIPEISAYLVESFGNSTRIDYGTGHEISFVMFLCCLFKVGAFSDVDKIAVGCRVFPTYIIVCRKLQQAYRMEPAGSHGVWSLDDYQFVPFIWGSSQLIHHQKIEPHAFLNEQILKEYSSDYMFLSCIQYINSVKTGPFAEHSNQLWCISGVPNWTKVNQGLVKMYKVEVLEKFPVVQHILFGSLMCIKPQDMNIQPTRAETKSQLLATKSTDLTSTSIDSSLDKFVQPSDSKID